MHADTTAPAADPVRRRRRRSPSVAAIYFATVAAPPLVIYFGLAASQTLGFILATAVILARSRWAPTRGSNLRWLAPAVLALVTLHFVAAATFQPVDAARALASLVPLTLLLFGAGYLTAILPRVPAGRLHKGLVRCFVLMCALALLAVLGVQPPTAEEWRKSVFPFFEPAVFALPFVPILMYACVSASGRARVGYPLLGLMCTGLIQNLTLAAGFLLVAAISFRWWVLALTVSLFAIGGAQLDLSYYTQRLDFSGEVVNFSNLVYVQGWQMIGESWERSSGFGLGFQQLGVNGTEVPAAQLLRSLRDGEDLNVLDGGFVFSKLTGEFGVFGFVMALVFLWFALRSLIALRQIDNRRDAVVPFVTLAHCSVLGYTIELFVRGGSYFTGTTMLLIASLWLLNGKQSIQAAAMLQRRIAPRQRRQRATREPVGQPQ